MDASSAPEVTRKILVLEQDKFLASLLHMLLHREGFKLHVITSETDALEYIQGQSPPELLFFSQKWLTDEIPSVLQLIKENKHWETTPIILLLNYYNKADIQRTSEIGVTDYLLQPFEPGALLDLIQKYI
jgi:DNA-binding response OmpR family regulator